jgi:hypothetical protein
MAEVDQHLTPVSATRLATAMKPTATANEKLNPTADFPI